MRYKLAVFIARMQPFHNGHAHVIDHALKEADRLLILVGSAREPRSIRSPWTYEERVQMLKDVYGPLYGDRILSEPLMDIRYNDALWLREVQKAVLNYVDQPDDKITLIGHQDKGEGYYTSLFPQWGSVAVSHMAGCESQILRDELIGRKPGGQVQILTNARLYERLQAFALTQDGRRLQEEYAFIESYKKGWDTAPFPPTHVTVDAVVVQSGHILLVERDSHPGKGLLALPGGFIRDDETLLKAMVRKLREETKIKVPAPVLAGSVQHQMVFDTPHRSVRGRTITHAFLLYLRNEDALPKVKGGDGSGRSFWLPLAKIDPEDMFEDHFFIIQRMLGFGA